MLTLSSASILPFSFPTWGDAYTAVTGEPASSQPVFAPAELYSAAQSKSSTSEPLSGKQMSVYVIDVGQGSSTLFTTGDNSILIDAGENDQGGKVLDCLNALKITHLDYMIGTHPHSDHIGGMDDVLEKVEVDTVILPKVPDAILPTTKTYEDVLTLLAEKKIKVITAAPDKSYVIGAMRLETFGPVGEYDDLNNESVVSKISFGNTRVLVSGDAETAAEKDILKKDFNLKSDIYIAGHHGSSTSTGKAFLEAIKPTFTAISCGENNDYGHPSASTLQKLKDKGVTVYRTDLNGNIVFTTDGENIAVKTEK